MEPRALNQLKKYWSVDNTRDFIRKKANGISEQEVPANNFLADAIEEDNAIYLCSNHKMVDESSEEKMVYINGETVHIINYNHPIYQMIL